MGCSDCQIPAKQVSHELTRVFVGEDDDEMRGLMVTALRRDGHQIVEAVDGLDLLRGIQSLRSLTPSVRGNVVVTDVRMPGASGLQVLAALRRLGPAIPVNIVTGFGDAYTHADAWRLGALAVFNKPFDLADLKRTVLRLSVSGLASPANGVS